MGRFLGIQKFGPDYDDFWAGTERRLRLASASDRRGQNKNSKNVVLSTLKGKSTIGTSAYETEVRIAIDDIRERFNEIIVRRTVHSVDNMGNNISGLEPFHEHVLIVGLYKHEMENLELLARDLVDGDAHKIAKFAGGHVRFVHNKLCIIIDLEHRIFTSPFEGHSFIRAATLARPGMTLQPWRNGKQIPLKSWMLLLKLPTGT